MRIFHDANIIFSAAKAPGAVHELLELATGRGHRCVVDPYVMEEARRNLAVKFPAGLRALQNLIRGWDLAPTTAPADFQLGGDLGLPEGDLMVLTAAINNRCQALVTGDRAHFGRLYGREIHGTVVYSPRSLAEVILSAPKPR